MQSVITSKYQTTIPKDVRDRLKLSVHDTLEWKIEEGKIVVLPVKIELIQAPEKLRMTSSRRVSLGWKNTGEKIYH